MNTAVFFSAVPSTRAAYNDLDYEMEDRQWLSPFTVLLYDLVERMPSVKWLIFPKQHLPCRAVDPFREMKLLVTNQYCECSKTSCNIHTTEKDDLVVPTHCTCGKTTCPITVLKKCLGSTELEGVWFLPDFSPPTDEEEEEKDQATSRALEEENEDKDRTATRGQEEEEDEDEEDPRVPIETEMFKKLIMRIMIFDTMNIGSLRVDWSNTDDIFTSLDRIMIKVRSEGFCIPSHIYSTLSLEFLNGLTTSRTASVCSATTTTIKLIHLKKLISHQLALGSDAQFHIAATVPKDHQHHHWTNLIDPAIWQHTTWVVTTAIDPDYCTYTKFLAAATQKVFDQ